MRYARMPLNNYCNIMQHATNPEKIRNQAMSLRTILGLKGSPIGVKFVQNPASSSADDEQKNSDAFLPGTDAGTTWRDKYYQGKYHVSRSCPGIWIQTSP